ncbi:MAG: ribbon-helix-helix protein, CopG family [Rhizobiales bacterium]|nr:ribbon-helix-helix protein, CopG family [Hyphomicrobiales bacterium]
MKRSISAKQKKRRPGRPKTGIRPMIGLRLSEAEVERVDQWAEHNGHRDRSTAIRAMIETALSDWRPKKS